MSTLTAEQLVALEDWQKYHRRRWKDRLRTAWETGDYYPYALASPLQQLRNEYGPRWLNAYRPGDKQVGWLYKFRSGNDIAWRTTYNVVDETGECIVPAAYHTKTDARKAACYRKITLIEDPK